jgi:endogenous inhibitor of DNA gyrase (YacG/DUF329 family)
MHKCGICGKEVEDRPKITNDGKCSKCCEDLKMKEKKEEEF